MIVAVDTFDWSDFPIYIDAGQDVRAEVTAHRRRPMTKVMEVYNLSMDRDQQLDQVRSLNY